MTVTVAEIAQRIGAEIIGDAQMEISGLGSLGTASPGQLSHLSSSNYRDHLASTEASAVILSADDAAACPTTALVVDNPYSAFALASQLFVVREHLLVGVHPSAVIGADCNIDPLAALGPNVVIGAGTSIGPGARLFANTSVGERCVLAEDVTLQTNVAIYSDVRIGARSVIHSGSVIGADGFGYTPDAKGHLQEIAQLGGVEIGADVSVGSCSTIDCGAIDDTVIEDGVKIDNQVQIGHNCRIGAHTLICGCVGIAGSSVIGKHCVFAGGSGVGGDKPVTICDGVVASACTTISQSVSKPGVYSGTIVFHDHNRWRRNALRFMNLNDLFRRVKRLEGRDQ
jgi:UDP-3-O-[3-hydroxymyristoyl] glucosamine N-acyltransferase